LLAKSVSNLSYINFISVIRIMSTEQCIEYPMIFETSVSTTWK